MIHPETATLAEFAEIAHRKRSYITHLKKTGRLVFVDGGKRVYVAESLARIESTKDPAKAAVAARHAVDRVTKAGQGAVTNGHAVAPVATPEADPDGDDAALDITAELSGFQGSRAMRERYLAKAAKRDYEISIGKLMDAAEVAAAVAHAATTLRTRLESLPDVLGPQLAAIHDEAQARATLAEAIEHALDETSRQFSNIAKAESA